MVIPIRCL